MIINNLNQFRTRVRPCEADAVLIVDAHTVLSCAITAERFQPVARRDAQFLESAYGVELIQFSDCNLP